MSERVKKAIKENVLGPELRLKPSFVTGLVKRTYYVSDENEDKAVEADKNCADVEIEHPFNGKLELLKRVPMLISPMMGGVQGRKVQVGDAVIVLFVNQDMKFPRIIGRLYSNYQDKNIEDSIVHGTDRPDYYDTIL